MSTPQAYLDTCFVCDERRRIVATREPTPTYGHLFCLVRGNSHCVWSLHADLPDDLAGAIGQFAQSEPPVDDFRRPPVHADEFRRLLGAYITSLHMKTTDPQLFSGPAMTFPDDLPTETDVEAIEDEQLLAVEFSGWVKGEIAGGRAPVFGAIEEGRPVSVCFCARTADAFAEAGVETVERYRGRGLAVRVTAAWARTLRAQGRTPLYSTDWSNQASLAVARKLGLKTYASSWSLVDPSR